MPTDWTISTSDVEPHDVETASIGSPARGPHTDVTIADVARRLGLVDVDDLGADQLVALAAAATEAATATGIAWPPGDDPPVALVRLLATAARRNPAMTGPAAQRLLDLLP